MNQRELQDEVAAALSNLALDGQREAYGFEIARAIQKRRGDRLLAPHGALYRALRNLENRRVIISRWERTEEIPKVEDRPRHRCYRLTGAGHDRAPAARADRNSWTGLAPGVRVSHSVPAAHAPSGAVGP